MNKIITTGCMAIATFAAIAVPTKTELERAKPAVENMTKADLAAYKAGEKTAQKVAAAHLAFAEKAESEAEKYLLLQGAFKLYARSGEYDLAADAIVAMKRDIKDLPPAVIAEIVGDELRYVSDDKAPRLVVMLKEAKANSVVEKSVASSAAGTAKPRPQGALLARRKGMKDTTHLRTTVDGYTWSYRVDNGEATIEAKKDGKFVCAVSPNPTGDVVIPSLLNDMKVTSIGENAFSRCKGLTAVTIPEGVTTIAKGAFGWCENLKSVTLPPTVKKIENCAFYFCGELESLTIPPSVTYIGEDVFHRCSGLKSIVIPEGVTIIGRDMFMGCSGLETLTIPANVERIDFHAFRECSGLMSLTFRGERPVCGNAIFEACPKLTEIHVPAKAKSWAGMKEWHGKQLVFDAK